MVGGVVRNEHHFLAAHPAAQQRLEESQEALRLKHRIKMRYHLSSTQIDGSKERHRFARRRVEHHRISLLRWNPHDATTAVLLKVAFIQTPEIKRRISCQCGEFF